MISAAEAEAQVLAAVTVLDTEWCDYREAGGRVLRRSIIADRELPPYDRVMMDGIAICMEGRDPDRQVFPLEGTAPAGGTRVELSNPDAAWEVMTGAVLPAGCDTVIPVEWVLVDSGVATLRSDANPVPGQHVHKRGSDYPRGAVLVEGRRSITSRDLAVAVSCGRTNLEVTRLPRVGLISSGDELVDPDAVPEPHQIRRSNTPAVECLIRNHNLGVTEVRHVRDDMREIQSVLETLFEEQDVLVISGGVSKGKKDYFPEALTALGVEVRFHGVAQRPGKPFWFGRHPRGVPVFAFPGNPVSTLVGAHRYLVPTLERMLGMRTRPPETLPLAAPFEFTPPLTLFLPVRREVPGNGQPVARPCPVKNSGDYASIIPTDGFVELPRELDAFSAGECFPFYPWR